MFSDCILIDYMAVEKLCLPDCLVKIEFGLALAEVSIEEEARTKAEANSDRYKDKTAKIRRIYPCYSGVPKNVSLNDPSSICNSCLDSLCSYKNESD